MVTLSPEATPGIAGGGSAPSAAAAPSFAISRAGLARARCPEHGTGDNFPTGKSPAQPMALEQAVTYTVVTQLHRDMRTLSNLGDIRAYMVLLGLVMTVASSVPEANGVPDTRFERFSPLSRGIVID